MSFLEIGALEWRSTKGALGQRCASCCPDLRITQLIHLTHLDKNIPGYIARRLTVTGSIESFPGMRGNRSRDTQCSKPCLLGGSS
jgi:hypothetical protein